MSQTPIFDALFDEFLAAHRWPASADVPTEEDFINLDPPIPFLHQTEEISQEEADAMCVEYTKVEHDGTPIPFRSVLDTQEIPADEPAPSIIQSLKELHSQPVETFGERIAREIEAQKAVAEMPDWMTSGELYKPFEIKAGPKLMAMLDTNPFVDLMAEHQHNILYPVTMPTRDAIGWTPREIETPALEPEEAEHVFPLTRDYHGRRRFLQKPSVTKIREIVENAVFEHTPA